MNQDVTASTKLPSGKIRISVSDATADLNLREHARWAGANLHLHLGELAAFSAFDRLPEGEVSLVRNMRSMASSALIAWSHAFVSYSTAVSDNVSSPLRTYSVLRKLQQRGWSLTDTTSVLADPGKQRTQTLTGTMVERFSAALGEWRGLLAPDHFDAMTQQIERLLSDEEELEEDKIVPSPSSFDDLLAFLSARPWDRAPAVGLDRRGHFSISWGKSRPRTDVTLTFLGEGLVKWYVFGLGRRRTGSAAGTSNHGDLARILSRLSCDKWMAR